MERLEQSGMTLIELMVGMTVGAIVLGGAFTLWKTHQEEGYRLERKIELRNVMTLSSKRIQRSVTLAGYGLGGAANLAKDAAAGSDTLTLYTNLEGRHSALLTDIPAGTVTALQVADPSIFLDAGFVAVGDGSSGEIRRVVGQTGSSLLVDAPFTASFAASNALAYPAIRERYYSDQASSCLMREGDGESRVAAKAVRNFRVAFRDRHGNPTDSAPAVRTVVFSFTGIFPAREGAVNSMVFSSTAIPRNTL